MFVCNSELEFNEAPNPSCCSHPNVMCEKCTRETLRRREALNGRSRSRQQSTIANDDMILNSEGLQKPEPLGIPRFTFNRQPEPIQARAQGVLNSAPPASISVGNGRYKPEPLGIPAFNYGRPQTD